MEESGEFRGNKNNMKRLLGRQASQTQTDTPSPADNPHQRNQLERNKSHRLILIYN